MTLPAAPSISIEQMRAEFGLTAPVVFPRDLYGKGGAPASGPLKFSDFLGRSANTTPATFTPAPGNYSRIADDEATFTINANRAVVWTVQATGGGYILDGGGNGASLTVAVDAGRTTNAQSTFTITANDGVSVKQWTVSLTAKASPINTQ